MSGIMDMALWPDIQHQFRIEVYDRDGGHRHPRIRIEVTAESLDDAAWLTGIQMPCVACGRSIHPIRARLVGGRKRKANHLYYAPCCPLDVNVGCSRGSAARDEYRKFRHLGGTLRAPR